MMSFGAPRNFRNGYKAIQEICFGKKIVGKELDEEVLYEKFESLRCD